MKEISELIKSDRNFYLSKNIFKRIGYMFLKNKKYYIYKYLKYVRLSSFHKKSESLLNRIKYIYYLRRKNYYHRFVNLEIDGGNFGEEMCIYHENIVINPNASIGNNCKFHGNNCIGNNGYSEEAPIIGSNVDIGFGACIIGNVEIADNVVIGANSLVNKSFLEKGSIIAGNPAKRIK